MKLVYCSKVYLYAMNAAYLPSVTHNTIVRISAYILNPNCMICIRYSIVLEYIIEFDLTKQSKHYCYNGF